MQLVHAFRGLRIAHLRRTGKEQKPHAEYEYKPDNGGNATVSGRIYISNKGIY